MKKITMLAILGLVLAGAAYGQDVSKPFTVTQTKAAIAGYNVTPDILVLTPGTRYQYDPRTDLWHWDVQAQLTDGTVVLFDGVADTKEFTATWAEVKTQFASETGTVKERFELAFISLAWAELQP